VNQFCLRCGAMHGPGNGLCVACGAPLGNPQPVRPRTWGKYFGWGAAVFVGVLGLAAAREYGLLGAPVENTPAAVAQAFVRYLYANQASRALDFAWADVPRPVLAGLVKDYAEGLQAMRTEVTSVNVQSVEENASNATVCLILGRRILGFGVAPYPMVFELRKIDGKWKVDFRFFASQGAAGVSEAPPVQGKTVPVDLSPLTKNDLTAYTNGSYYPPNGGPLTVADVPFTLATMGSHTAILQAPGDAPASYSIPVQVQGVRTVYTLSNSAFGVCGTPIGELEFAGAKSAPFIYKLTEGVNIRDHGQGGYCNNVTGVAGTARFGGGAVRLDMQKITLPPSFATDTLLSITFKTHGRGSEAGAPFLAAITVVQP
jgi:hypothetical protein